MDIDDTRIQAAIDFAHSQYLAAHGPGTPENERDWHRIMVAASVQTLSLLGIDTPIHKWAIEVVALRAEAR